MKCYECSGKVIKKKVKFSMYGVNLGLFPAEVCTKCGEEVFTSKVSEEIEKIAKKKGVWGLSTVTKITKTGNSLAVRIPKKIVDYLKLRSGETAYVHPENHKLIVETKV